MIPPEAVIRRGAELVYRELPEGAGLMHLGDGAFYSLNSTGAVIWDLIEGGVTFAGLVASLVRSIPDAPDGVADEASSFIEALAERDLVEIVIPPD
jgi:hypothetical protein